MMGMECAVLTGDSGIGEGGLGGGRGRGEGKGEGGEEE